MSTRISKASWLGRMPEGHGNIRTESGAVDGTYSFPSRFEEGAGTNPEELLAAAHAACFAMALANMLGQEGHDVERIDASAHVTIETVEGAPTITRSAISTEGHVLGIDADEFGRLAEQAKEMCPVSRALGALETTVVAQLAG